MESGQFLICIEFNSCYFEWLWNDWSVEFVYGYYMNDVPDFLH
jgi:hypothetical protein